MNFSKDSLRDPEKPINRTSQFKSFIASSKNAREILFLLLNTCKEKKSNHIMFYSKDIWDFLKISQVSTYRILEKYVDYGYMAKQLDGKKIKYIFYSSNVSVQALKCFIEKNNL